MAECGEGPSSPGYSELIWEAGGRCTVQAGEVALAAGEHTPWTPDLLVAAGLAADIMTMFMRLRVEAGLDLLAYASQQRVDRSPEDIRLEIVITPCITVRTVDDAVLALALWNRAVAASPLSRVVTCPLRIEPRIVALPDAVADCEC